MSPMSEGSMFEWAMDCYIICAYQAQQIINTTRYTHSEHLEHELVGPMKLLSESMRIMKQHGVPCILESSLLRLA